MKLKKIYNTMLWRVLAISLFATLGQKSIWADNNYRESDIKAAMLLRIVRYVNYPETTAKNDSKPIKLCIAGKHDITRALQTLYKKNRRVRSRSFQVIQLSDALLEDCQVLFISGDGSTAEFITWLDKAQAKPMLTIADTAGSAENGVMVNFIPKRNFIGFELNPGAASLSELQFSSELLKLGTLKDTTRVLVDQETNPDLDDSKREGALETEENETSGSDAANRSTSEGQRQ